MSMGKNGFYISFSSPFDDSASNANNSETFRFFLKKAKENGLNLIVLSDIDDFQEKQTHFNFIKALVLSSICTNFGKWVSNQIKQHKDYRVYISKTDKGIKKLDLLSGTEEQIQFEESMVSLFDSDKVRDNIIFSVNVSRPSVWRLWYNIQAFFSEKWALIKKHVQKKILKLSFGLFCICAFIFAFVKYIWDAILDPIAFIQKLFNTINVTPLMIVFIIAIMLLVVFATIFVWHSYINSPYYCVFQLRKSNLPVVLFLCCKNDAAKKRARKIACFFAKYSNSMCILSINDDDDSKISGNIRKIILSPTYTNWLITLLEQLERDLDKESVWNKYPCSSNNYGQINDETQVEELLPNKETDSKFECRYWSIEEWNKREALIKEKYPYWSLARCSIEKELIDEDQNFSLQFMPIGNTLFCIDHICNIDSLDAFIEAVKSFTNGYSENIRGPFLIRLVIILGKTELEALMYKKIHRSLKENDAFSTQDENTLRLFSRLLSEELSSATDAIELDQAMQRVSELSKIPDYPRDMADAITNILTQIRKEIDQEKNVLTRSRQTTRQ